MNRFAFKTSRLVWGVAAVSVALAGGSASAEVLLIDFGNTSAASGGQANTASPDTNGNTWNNVNPGVASPNLLDTQGNATAIDLAVTTGVGTNGSDFGGLLAPSPALLGDLAIESATRDYFFVAGTNVLSFTLGDLDPTKTYDLDFFGTRLSGSDRQTTYTVTGLSGASTVDIATSGTAIGNGGYNGNNDTIVAINGVAPDANGDIVVDVSVKAGGFAYLGAMQIAVVPEPASMLLVGLGGLAMLGRRRQA